MIDINLSAKYSAIIAFREVGSSARKEMCKLWNGKKITVTASKKLDDGSFSLLIDPHEMPQPYISSLDVTNLVEIAPSISITPSPHVPNIPTPSVGPKVTPT